jgi:hypothetical protein
MQEINRMSQEIVNYFNQNPQLVKDGARVNLDAIITDKFADRTLELVRRTVQISIEPMSSFHQNQNGRWELRLPGGSMSSHLVDPVNGPVNAPVWDYTRSDRYWDKKGPPQDFIPYQVEQGSKVKLALPAEILTRSLEGGDIGKRIGQAPYSMQHRTNQYARGLKSTIAHEINHSYNSFQGMDLAKTRRQVEKNKIQQQQQPTWQTFAANADDEAFLSKNLRLYNDPNSPKVVKNLYVVSRELIDSRKHFQQLEYTIQLNEKTKIPELEQKIATAATPAEAQSLTKYLEMMRSSTENMKQQAIQERAEIKKLSARQQQLKKAVAKIQLDPNKPTSYHGDAYWSSPTEVNSRLQQASMDMAAEIKPGMTNQAITELIQKTFGDHHITQEFVDPDRMHKHFKPGSTLADREFKDFMKDTWSKAHPEFKQEAFNSAMGKPEFKRYVTIAYKFIQAEQANPISTSKASQVTLGQRLKAALIGIPQAEIPNTILPSAKDAVISGARQSWTAGSPVNDNLLAATVEASKKLDTPGAIKTLQVGGKVLIPVGIVTELYRGFDQIKALPQDLPDEQYQLEVEKIIAKLVAEFGLVYVGALTGAWLSGLALSAVLPGLGTVAGAVVGFIAGGAAGFLALEFAGDSVRAIAEKIVTVMRTNKQPKLTGAQGAANARNAVRNFSTAGNPSPALNPEPAYESLDRIVELAVVKKPT